MSAATRTIRRIQTGTRIVAGAEWPITSAVIRWSDGDHVEWQVIRGYCLGTTDRVTIYATRREALAALEYLRTPPRQAP